MSKIYFENLSKITNILDSKSISKDQLENYTCEIDDKEVANGIASWVTDNHKNLTSLFQNILNNESLIDSNIDLTPLTIKVLAALIKDENFKCDLRDYELQLLKSAISLLKDINYQNNSPFNSKNMSW